MKISRVFLVLLGLVLSSNPSAWAVSYTSDFNTDADGWDEFDYLPDGIRDWQATGGVGNSGFMHAWRVADPYGQAAQAFTENTSILAQPGGEGGGPGVDYAATYGQQIHIQFYVKDFDGGGGPGIAHPNIEFGSNVYGLEDKGTWKKAPGWHPGLVDPITGQPYPDIRDGQWYQFNTIIDTTWTDAQANANGWYLNPGSSGTPTWQFVMQHINVLAIYGNGASTNPAENPDGHSELGIDNVTVQTYGAVTPKNRGDVTEDDFVGADDLVRILTHWGESGPGVTWSDGDCAPYNDGITTGDQFVGADDYVEVLTYWGTDYSSPEPAPEPATLVLLLLCGSVLLRRNG